MLSVPQENTLKQTEICFHAPGQPPRENLKEQKQILSVPQEML
jgi:hypothetical protein